MLTVSTYADDISGVDPSVDHDHVDVDGEVDFPIDQVCRELIRLGPDLGVQDGSGWDT